MSNGPVAADELRLLIERWERLQEEKEGIAADQRDVMQEAKSRGFDTKTMRAIITLRKKTPEQRREEEALLDTYRAALGMLDGTPLGRWALERLTREDEPKPGPDAPAPGDAEPAPPPEPEPDLEEAKAMGREAARSGFPVTANPFPARDIRRAAWDEAWCHELGTDGMDIPDALKPTPKPKKGKPEGGAEDGKAGEE